MPQIESPFAHLLSLSIQITKPPPVAFKDRLPEAVATIVSNCAAPNNRLHIIQELQKGIEVHSFGFCMHNKNLPANQVRPCVLLLELISFRNKLARKSLRSAFLLPSVRLPGLSCVGQASRAELEVMATCLSAEKIMKRPMGHWRAVVNGMDVGRLRQAD